MKSLNHCLVVVALTSISMLVSAQQSSGQAALVSLAHPLFPPLARAANISGQVKVLLTVHQDGSTEAVVLDGHPMLREAALDSAKSSKFECKRCDAPVHYAITYTFSRTENGNCCDGVGAPVEVTQKPEDTDGQGMRVTEVLISTEHYCICDLPATIEKARVRSWKCLYLWKCAVPKVIVYE